VVGVRRYEAERDESWAAGLLDDQFGGRAQVRRGELLDVLALGGFVASHDGEPAGLLTYRIDGEECELAVLIASVEGSGVGSALVDALRAEAASAGCARIWVVTTNDNLRALRFYQRRGFVLRALRPGAVDEARRTLKASIGEVGEDDIPIRDELELVLSLR
jgi:ribosomal protein S18 acetylase RimI-like enzyme